jgi:hypothetical protein
MKKNIRWIVVYCLSPLIAIILVILQIPAWEESIRSHIPRFADSIGWFLVVGTIYTYYVSIWSPYNDWLKMREQTWDKLNEVAEKLKERYADHDFSMNIMIPRLRFCYFIEPHKRFPGKKKFSPYGYVFQVVWNYGTHHVKRNLKFTTNQGACGNAYVEEQITTVDFTRNSKPDFNFTHSQTDSTSQLKMLVSCPIVFKKNGAYEQKLSVLGVLNVESWASAKILNPTTQMDMEILKHFYENINTLVQAYIKLQ